MPTPPTSTPWVPMWPLTNPAGVLAYRGDWVAGSYQDGDVVVNNGVAFLCVGGPTTDVPDTAPWGLASAAGGRRDLLPGLSHRRPGVVLVDSSPPRPTPGRSSYIAGIADAHKWLFIGGRDLAVEEPTAANEPGGTINLSFRRPPRP